MRHYIWIPLLLTALAAGLSACSDGTLTAPDSTAISGEALPSDFGQLEAPTTLRVEEDSMTVPRTRNYRAVLNGADAGVDTRARGQAWFQRSLDGTILYYRLIVSNIHDVTMAHIHLAPVGEDGPPVVWLYPDSAPAVTWEGRVNGVLAWGTIEASELAGPLAGMTLDDLLQAMAEGGTYVNVHTESHPAGEIRGQISPRGCGPH